MSIAFPANGVDTQCSRQCPGMPASPTPAIMRCHQTSLASPWLSCISLITSEAGDYFWMVISHWYSLFSKMSLSFVHISIELFFSFEFYKNSFYIFPSLTFISQLYGMLSQRSFSFLCCHRLSIFFSPFLCLSVYTHLHTGRGKMLKKRHHWLLLGCGRLRWFVAHFSVFFCMAFFFLVKSIIILIKNSCFFKSSSMAPGFTSFLEKVYNV